MDLIHKLKKARTKDDLEALGIEHLGIDVDKREAKEVLRVKLINEAESQGWATSDSEMEPEAPEAEVSKSETPEPVQAAAPAATVKMGRNKKTGRLIPWTAAMAKFSHMEQL
jgi:hypothetical protein